MAVFSPCWTGAHAQGFFGVYRKTYPVSRNVLREVANQYHNWAEHSAQKWGVEIVEDSKGRRDEFVEPYFEKARTDQVVLIIKAREPAGIMPAIGAGQKWHLETKYRWGKQYNFYIQDAEWGPMFVRVCPYFPFSTRICLNQHNWLARKMNKPGYALPKVATPFATVVILRLSRRWQIP